MFKLLQKNLYTIHSAVKLTHDWLSKQQFWQYFVQWRVNRLSIALHCIMNRLSVYYKFQETFFEFYAFNKEFGQLVSNICDSIFKPKYLLLFFQVTAGEKLKFL